MQRIAVLMLCAGLWSNHAAAGSCEEVGTAVGGFIGGATGYGLVARLGVASNWVAAGLYGAGISIAAMRGRSWSESGCDSLPEKIRWFGQMSCEYSGFYVDCTPVKDVAKSLATDFLICPACTYDEVFSAFLLEDGAREDFLQDMQYRKRGIYAVTTQVMPRNQLGRLDASVLNSYFSGLQAGFQLLKTSTIYRSRK